MDRFKIKALKPESRNQNVIKNCYGFTLIELLVVISIIAILIGLLLPVIQTKREEYAANKATQNLMAMIEASNEYFRNGGSYPNTIAELVQFCRANPGSCSLDPQLASGRTGGYLYTLTKTGTGTLEFEAEPEIPGITGSITHTYNSDLRLIASTPTPGSDAARQRAFDNILASGAATVVQLLNLDPTAASQVREYTETTMVNNGAFDMIDTSHDGKVSINEINTFTNTTFDDEALKNPLTSWLAQAYLELRLDSLSDQDSQAIFVTDRDVDGGDFLLFSYDGLADLTRVLVDGPILTQLTAKLDAAEAAEANGNLNRKAKSLKQYRKLVKRQIGTSLTSTNANILNTISTTL